MPETAVNVSSHTTTPRAPNRNCVTVTCVGWRGPGLLRVRLHDGRGVGERTMERRHTPSLAYVAEPTHRSRAAIIEERRHINRADPSFDFDGDGNVDALELMVGSILDINKDGVLSPEEMVNAAALIDRLRKHYVFGLDVSTACVIACLPACLPASLTLSRTRSRSLHGR